MGVLLWQEPEWGIIKVLLNHLRDIIGGIPDISFFNFIQNINFHDDLFGCSQIVLNPNRQNKIQLMRHLATAY
jgi:hypothetical protein